MDDLDLLSVREDDNLVSFESRLISSIENQIMDPYGEFTGDIDIEVDFVSEYIKKIYLSGNPIDVIENFEFFCSDSGRESDYDTLVTGLISVFKNSLGITLDVDREVLSFSDIYDIYVIFVLSFKDTLLLSTKGNLFLKGITLNNIITHDMIVDYTLSDDFSANDDFIRNAAYNMENYTIMGIKDLISDNLIVIDNDIFVKYIQGFIEKIQL